MSGQDYNKDVYIPLDTLQSRIDDQRHLHAPRLGQLQCRVGRYNQITSRSEIPMMSFRPPKLCVKHSTESHGKTNDFDVVVPLELLQTGRSDPA